jgi:toxin CcdB
MGRFDVYRNARPGSRFPLLLDVQADLLADLATRIVIPLMSDRETGAPIRSCSRWWPSTASATS